ncbi:hypothetical protein TYRP_016326 [Tyrophagus putrescentiae]|nr:hypothetical protein TYRP_016326 [Tyrophagus putrescentiae]
MISSALASQPASKFSKGTQVRLAPDDKESSKSVREENTATATATANTVFPARIITTTNHLII